MNTELENLLKLVVRGLTLNDFNWSDVENGCIKNLYFLYTTHSGKKGTLDLGNIGIDFYEDDGDHCLELTTGEILIDILRNDCSDLAEMLNSCEIQFDENNIPEVETDFGWNEFFGALLSYYPKD